MYLEGDASMRSYDDAEGKRQSSLSIVQRGSTLFSRSLGTELDGMR